MWFQTRSVRGQLTSWKREDISHTRQELGLCISQRCRSERKKSRSSGVCVSACTMQFMKHVLPRLISPRSPGGRQEAVTGHWLAGLTPGYHKLLHIHVSTSLYSSIQEEI